MNKYITYDIENGIKQIKIGLLNSFHEIIRNNISEITIDKHIPLSLLIECFKELNLKLSVQYFPTPMKYEWRGNIEIDYFVDTGETILRHGL